MAMTNTQVYVPFMMTTTLPSVLIKRVFGNAMLVAEKVMLNNFN
jgi:hypothetical protein